MREIKKVKVKNDYIRIQVVMVGSVVGVSWEESFYEINSWNESSQEDISLPVQLKVRHRVGWGSLGSASQGYRWG